ncbi:hypothetical protein pmac_cds_441 [Pandoravirus macleodensis]|uniref:Uncharacterized protein n=1 Tax=Pandoravirus macleodensis TaxID=2107707 RepID=A0A2U7UF77_9VIRU|nr:hypothetical protein pmac_cds_441 [Pandoravirus macleodensis]AVK77129.1 hypothetical protein pmac_cds_441 [Pandoravirus macleodensis]
MKNLVVVFFPFWPNKKKEKMGGLGRQDFFVLGVCVYQRGPVGARERKRADWTKARQAT